jgi:hypothetical protein
MKKVKTDVETIIRERERVRACVLEGVRERFRELSTSLVRDKGERLREKKDNRELTTTLKERHSKS